jgi:transmembrane protein 18
MEEEIANTTSSGSFGDFMSEIEAHMLKFVRESYKTPTNLHEHFQAFITAVNWNEKFIIGLICMHVLFFTFFLLFRKNSDVQFVIFMIIGLLIYFSERLNSYGNEHWREFASQNYFDRSGVFASMCFSGPLLGIATLQLVSFFALLILLYIFVIFCLFVLAGIDKFANVSELCFNYSETS